MFREREIEELKEAVSLYEDIFVYVADKLQEAKFSDVVAHVLKEVMKGIDKARDGKKEPWTREDVFRLIEIMKPTVIKK